MKTMIKQFVFVGFLSVACSTQAQDSRNVAAMRVKEAESLVRLTAEGRELYNADAKKLQWADYCSASGRLADDGQLREAIRMASRALFMGV